jgi:hypothetical protein
MPERIRRMRSCRSGENRARRITPRQSRCNAPHAPGTTEVQAIKMDQLRIAAVSNNGGMEQPFRLADCNPSHLDSTGDAPHQSASISAAKEIFTARSHEPVSSRRLQYVRLRSSISPQVSDFQLLS